MEKREENLNIMRKKKKGFKNHRTARNFKTQLAIATKRTEALNQQMATWRQEAEQLVHEFQVAFHEMNEAWESLVPAEKNAVHLQFPRLRHDVGLFGYATEWEFAYRYDLR